MARLIRTEVAPGRFRICSRNGRLLRTSCCGDDPPPPDDDCVCDFGPDIADAEGVAYVTFRFERFVDGVRTQRMSHTLMCELDRLSRGQVGLDQTQEWTFESAPPGGFQVIESNTELWGPDGTPRIIVSVDEVMAVQVHCRDPFLPGNENIRTWNAISTGQEVDYRITPNGGIFTLEVFRVPLDLINTPFIPGQVFTQSETEVDGDDENIWTISVVAAMGFDPDCPFSDPGPPANRPAIRPGPFGGF